MQRVISGETELFYELIRPYERGVFLAAASILGNDADAEDAAQEAILKAYKNLARFRQESKFSTWLIQIAINEAKMKLRRARRPLNESLDTGQQTDDGDYIPADFADWRGIPSDALEQRELRGAVNKALKSLPEKYRTVLVLRGAADEHCRQLISTTPPVRTPLRSLIKSFLNTIRFGFAEKVTRAFLASCVPKFSAHLSPKL